MALDPLKFKVAIEKRQFESDFKAVKDALAAIKDASITVKIDNLQQIERQIESIGQKLKDATNGAPNDFFKNLNKALANLSQEAEKQKKSMSEDTAMRNYQRNLETIDVEIRKLKQSMEALNKTEAFLNKAGRSSDAFDVKRGDVQKRIDLLEQLRQQEELLKKSDALTRPQMGEKFAAVWKDASQFRSEINSFNASIREYVANIQRLNEAQRKLSGWEQHLGRLRNGDVDFSKGESALNKIHDMQRLLQSANVQDSASVQELIRRYNILGETVRKTIKEQERLNASKVKDDKNAKILDERQVAALKQANEELAKLQKMVRDMEATSAKGKELHLDTSKLDAQIAKMKQYQTTLEALTSTGGRTDYKYKMGADYGADKFRAGEASKALTAQIREEERAIKDREAAQRRAASATQQMTAEEQRLAQAIQQSIGATNRQSRVMSDLKSMAAQFVSVYAGQQFLSNIIEIGGQLEMQRLSIGAILQDTAQATDLFNRIKGLALQSPFGVVELDQYTKQLSAYGFQYNELFDMTKRLADISAGAGTDVSRLALALGHVRAEGALTGYTLRQFAMNNIPMLGKLSERLSELEGRIVTASEVRKRVSKKQIDYEMVESVIKELTDQGGMFYNMQEVISGSVKAKWKNLRDAFDIMYGEMAESGVGGMLKDVATSLTALAKNWKQVGSVVMAAVGVYGLAKVAMMAQNALIGKQTAAVYAGIAADKKAEMSKLRLASVYRTLTVEEQKQLASGWQLNSVYLTRALNTKKLTTEDLMRSVALGKVNKEMAIAAIMNANLANAEKQRLYQTIAGIKTYSIFTGAVNGMRMAWVNFKASLGGMLASPMTWIMVGVTAITHLYQRYTEQLSRAAELAKNINERATEGIKNIKTLFEETGATMYRGSKPDPTKYSTETAYKSARQNWENDAAYTLANFGNTGAVQFEFPKSSDLNSAELTQLVDKYTEFIKNYAATPNTMLSEVFRNANNEARTLAEQYDVLTTKVSIVAQAYQKLQLIAPVAEAALTSTGSAFNDDLIKNINDFAKATKTLNGDLLRLQSTNKKLFTSALNAAKGEDTFKAAVDDANAKMMEKEHRNLTEMEQVQMLMKHQKEYTEAFQKYSDEIGHWNMPFSTASDVQTHMWRAAGAQDTMNQDIEGYSAALKTGLIDRAGSETALQSPAWKEAILKHFQDLVAQASEAGKDISDEVLKALAKDFHINVDAETVKAVEKVNQLQKDLEALVGHEWHIDITAATNFSDVITKIRQDYKSAQDYFNNVKPLMINMGVNVAGGMKPLTAQQRQSIISRWMAANPTGTQETIIMALDQWDAMALAMKDAMDFSRATGISLTDSNPGGKVLKTPKNKTGKKTGTGHTEDKEAKAWRERIRLLNDARQSYKKWEKEVGAAQALERVKEQFKELIDPKDVQTLEAYEDALKRLRSQAEARKSKRKGKDEAADEIIRQVDKALDDVAFIKFEEERDKFTSNMDKSITNLTRRWEIFNSVLQKTGDRMLAMRLANFQDEDMAFGVSNAPGALQTHIDFTKSMVGEMEAIDFDKVLGMSDKEIEQYVKQMYAGFKGYEKEIAGVINALKDWKKMQLDATKEDLQAYADLIASARTYAATVQKNNGEYQRTLSLLHRLREEGAISREEADTQAARARAERDSKNYRASSEYAMLMEHSKTMPKKEFFAALDRAIEMLNNSLKEGAISIAEYTQEMEKLKQIRTEWQKNGFLGERGTFGAFATNGVRGLMDYYKGKENRYIRESADALERYGEDSHEFGEAQAMANKYGKLRENLEKLTDNADDVVKVLEGLENGIKLVTDMFEALGAEGAANVGKDVGGVLSGALSGASSMSALGAYGMIAGGAMGAITSIAQLHDTHRDRSIERLRSDIKKIDNTLNTIKELRERELGYYSKDAYKKLRDYYAANRSSNLASNAMYWRYNLASGEGSGYAQELALLEEKRADIMRQFDDEQHKKNSSDDAMEEYMQQITELDMLIQNFAADLAKELWEIDLKGWADQIGDALMDAFENGTSAAVAFKDAVSDIMRSVVSQMLKVGIIQPMMKTLEDRLFGENGAFDKSNPEASMGAVLTELGRFFGEGGEGQQMINAAGAFLTGAEDLLKENFGITLKGSSQATQTSGIKSQATEESIGIVSGQLARIAQDVSVQRIFQTQLTTEQMPKLLENAQMQQVLMENSLQSVRAIEKAIINGDGAMYDAISRMSRKIDKAITPEGRMRVE